MNREIQVTICIHDYRKPHALPEATIASTKSAELALATGPEDIAIIALELHKQAWAKVASMLPPNP